ncbi:hypothetical protein ABPG74_022272 [Tetrahymena malaccensis]
MEEEFMNQDEKSDEKPKGTKKSKQKIEYEIDAGQDDHEKNYVEKDIKQQILEICLQIFPYPQPYAVQVECMKKIINSLCEKKNLLFQSPTGTGKTLVTICSALAYAHVNPDAQVLVLTRTNEQINGFIKEIRKIENYPSISRYSILAGRGQFCLNLDKFKEKFQQQEIPKSKYNKYLTKSCNEKIKKCSCENCKISKIEPNNNIDLDMSIFQRYKYVDIGQRIFQDNQDQDQTNSCQICPHYRIYKYIKEKREQDSIKINIHFPLVRSSYDQPYTLPDIEDMKNLFQQEKLGCPFYFNKLATQNSKLVFSTYNYVIKQNILASIKDLFRSNIIVIFDEAHNISEQAEQEQNTKLLYKYLDEYNNTLDSIQKIFQKPQKNDQYSRLCQEIKASVKLDIKEESDFLKNQLKKKTEKCSESKCYNDKNEIDDEYDEEKAQSKPKYAKCKIKIDSAEQKKSKRKFNQSIQLSSKDLFDQTLSTINQCQQISDDSPEFLKQIQSYIKDSNSSQVDVENIFKIYQEQRIKEIYNFFDNFQNFSQIQKENFEFLEKIFDIKHQYQNKLFCKLFSDKEIVKQFELLKVNDVAWAQNFMDNLTKSYKMLQYIKNLIQINYQEESFQEKNEQNKHNGNQNIIVKEKNQVYEVNTNDRSNIKKIGEIIKIKYIQKVWFFFFRMLKMKKLHNSQEDPLYLCNHYISLLRNENQSTPVLQIGCLSASYIFKEIYKKINISSLILTSGTLEPFELIQKSLDLQFQTYSSPHILNSQTNLFTQFISSYDEQDICFSMKKLSKEEDKDKIFLNSQIVINIIMSKLNKYTQQVKKKCGIVIFFKSYQMLQEIGKLMKQTQNLDFKYFKETKDSNDFKEQYSSYKYFIQKNISNCIFLAVNRGKLSEGIDLKDDLCRVVILFGIPYANLNDPYIICKKTHASLYLGESQWYKKEAIKVVNQSAGRCIRYKDDWGCVFFLDSQYSSENNVKQHISKWILEGQRKIYQHESDDWIEAYDKFLDIKAQEQTNSHQF